MKEEIEDFYISDRTSHYVFSDNEDFIAVAVNPDTPEHERQAIEWEVKGHQKVGVRDGRRRCYKKGEFLNSNRQSINLIKIALEDHGESWIQEVKTLLHLTNEVDRLAGFLATSENAIEAAVEILKYRGEVPEDYSDA